MKRYFSKNKGILFVLPSLLGVMLFYIIPFISSVTYCFTSGLTEKKFVGLMHFRTLFQNQNYRLALHNTIFITGVALPLLCLMSLVGALIVETELRKLRWLQGLLLIPMALPAASLMLVWKDVFGQQGIVNGLLHTRVDWLHSEFAPWIVIFMIVWKNLGYNILLLMSTLLTMPKEYVEAARLDGAGFWQISWRIKVPYLVPVIFFTIIISLSNCFKIFREVYLLQGEYPENNLYLLQHFMNNHFMKLNYDLLTSAAFTLYVVIFVFIFMLMRWQQRYIKENI